MPKEINSDLLRGNINTIILSALYSGDRYGYEIVNEIEQKSRGQFSIKQPTLYSCLKRLESQGFVTSYWGEQSNGGRRKYFSLTELGKEVFKQCQDDYEYSRTVIDKLISENRYDFGPQDEAAVASADDQVNVLSTQPLPADSTSEQTDDNQQLSLSDIDTSLSVLPDEKEEDNQPSVMAAENGDDAHFLSEDERYVAATEAQSDDNGFIPYNTQPDQSTGRADDRISWFDAGVAAEASAAAGDDGSSSETAYNSVFTSEKTEDINDIFMRNSGESSYFDDLKTNDAAASSTFTSDNFSDLMGDTAADKFQYEPDYSEAEYPYADSSDNASALIEAELSPLQKEEKPDFYDYHDRRTFGNAVAAAENEIASKTPSGGGYQDVLSGIIDKFNDNHAEITKTDIENNARELGDKVQVRAFGNIVESARELGEEVVVRVNDNKSKHQYAVKYYYKDNLLRLVSSGILFVVMLLESLITYIICKNVFGAQGRYDTLVFVAAIIVALVLPIHAGLKYYADPDSTRRIEPNMTETFWFKIVVMALVCLLAFGLNLFMGMPLNGSITDYSVSLFLPIILSTNLPLSYLIFKLLYAAKFFLAKE